VKIRIDCGRGTYIRAIARDLGKSLNVGGYLTALRRTRSGEFHVDQAHSIEQLRTDGIERHLIVSPAA
jgi:tRNA pseudouridine55 synthase